jgi:predicted ATPase/class 3 adenylate cyclase
MGGAQTIAFMLTDVEGSTRLWERDSTSMAAAMARLDEIIAQTAVAHGGQTVRERGEGDSSFNVFTSPSRAVAAAVALQRALAGERWPDSTPIRVRLAVHVGEAQFRDGDYYGSAVNRCARLRALAHGGQAVISAAARALVADQLADGTWLLDLGSHRLKDLAAPERIYQVCHADLQRDFPQLRGLDALPNNLPIQLTTFIGRDAELATVSDLLRSERLVTLTGAGGCGKTRLALEVAAAACGDYDDGVWFIDLSAVMDPRLVPDTAATALGLHERSGFGAGQAADPAAAATDAIVHGLADRRSLIVLDNCEHVVDAAASLVQAVLENTRSTSFLTTSRETLGLPGEAPWRVPSLAVPVTGREPSADEFIRFDAVRLFLDRSRHHLGSAPLAAADRRAIARICTEVDGIPLAVELAAARTRVLGLDQIADRLRDQVGLLRSSRRGVQSRQATLQAAIDWSYNLLDPDEQALFRSLAVFSGGWTLDAAESVCRFPASGVLEGLERLVDKSMVLRADDSGAARFRLLEPLRQYGLQQVTAREELTPLRSRHLEWHTSWAREIGPELKGPRQAAVLAALDAELDNVRAAIEWGIKTGRREALELAASLRLFWQYRWLLAEGRRYLEGALRVPAPAPPGLRAEALIGLGRLAFGLRDYEAASRHHTAALELARAHDLPVIEATATWYLGQVEWFEGRRETAAALFEDAVRGARSSGDQYLAAVALIDLAVFRQDAGLDAEVQIREALDACRASGDLRNTSLALRILGTIQRARGQTDEALVNLRTAAALSRGLGTRSSLADAQFEVGRLLVQSGELATACDALAEALDLAVELDYSGLIADCAEAIADIAQIRNDARAAALLIAASDMVRARGGSQQTSRDSRRVEIVAAWVSGALTADDIRGLHSEGRAMSPADLAARARLVLAQERSAQEERSA